MSPFRSLLFEQQIIDCFHNFDPCVEFLGLIKFLEVRQQGEEEHLVIVSFHGLLRCVRERQRSPLIRSVLLGVGARLGEVVPFMVLAGAHIVVAAVVRLHLDVFHLPRYRSCVLKGHFVVSVLVILHPRTARG